MKRLKVLFITAWYPDSKQPLNGIFVREHAKAVELYNDVIVLHIPDARTDVRQLWQIEQEKDRTLTEGIPTYRLKHRRFFPPLHNITRPDIGMEGCFLFAYQQDLQKSYCCWG